MDAASKISLIINDEKTEYMQLKMESVNVDGYIFHRVPQFKYLDILLTKDNELTTMTKLKI
jgi:hypothetical protein